MRAALFPSRTALSSMKTACWISSIRCEFPFLRKLKKAQQLLAQRDRILAQSQEEANRTLQLAREKSEQLVEKDGIVQAAHARSEQIIAQGRAEAEKQKHDADDYVLDTLQNLEAEMERILGQVRNGVRALQSERVVLHPTRRGKNRKRINYTHKKRKAALSGHSFFIFQVSALPS